MAGVFITKGMTVGVPAEQFVNVMKGGTLIPLVRFNVVPMWFRIAMGHRDHAVLCRSQRDQVWQGADEDAKAEALEKELESSMQAIVATAIALDALYAILVPHAGISNEVQAKWRKNSTPRFGQVAEVYRRVFKLSNSSMRLLRKDLRPIFWLRDRAVHPEGRLVAAAYHEELGVGTDPRFGWFRATNAETIFTNGSWIVWTLVHDGKSQDPQVLDLMAVLQDRLRAFFPDGHPRQDIQVRT